MKRRRKTFLFLSIIVIAVGGCCPTRFVAVPEGKLRIEDTRQDRIPLPLDRNSVARIERFLDSSGVRHRDEGGLAIEAAAVRQRYRELLATLQDAQKLHLLDVTSKRTFAQWLKYPAIRNVVDAREWGKIFPRPAALSDGKYWWIFYAGESNRLSHLLIVNSRTEEPASR
jgi:hypothetical protein